VRLMQIRRLAPVRIERLKSPEVFQALSTRPVSEGPKSTSIEGGAMRRKPVLMGRPSAAKASARSRSADRVNCRIHGPSLQAAPLSRSTPQGPDERPQPQVKARATIGWDQWHDLSENRLRWTTKAAPLCMGNAAQGAKLTAVLVDCLPYHAQVLSLIACAYYGSQYKQLEWG